VLPRSERSGSQIKTEIGGIRPRTWLIHGDPGSIYWFCCFLWSLKIKPGRAELYPHQISAGERQRVLMAMALITDPAVLVLDEPVASVDVITKSHLADVISEQVDSGKAVLMITHDLSFAPVCSDRCEVLYFGSILESLPSHELLDAPRHPYPCACQIVSDDGACQRPCRRKGNSSIPIF